MQEAAAAAAQLRTGQAYTEVPGVKGCVVKLPLRASGASAMVLAKLTGHVALGTPAQQARMRMLHAAE